MSIYESSKCTSCMACYNACTKNCIEMNYNNSNNLEPCINENLCVHCNLCLHLCPENNPVQKNRSLEAYACWSLNDLERKSSSSGGIASIFYSHFITNKLGSTYGCSYDENLQLKFSKANTVEDLIKFKTSKYTQAYIGNTFKEVLQDLKEDKFVIFVGTPCQVAGLKKFLRTYTPLRVRALCRGLVGTERKPLASLSDRHWRLCRNKGLHPLRRLRGYPCTPTKTVHPPLASVPFLRVLLSYPGGDTHSHLPLEHRHCEPRKRQISRCRSRLPKRRKADKRMGRNDFVKIS